MINLNLNLNPNLSNFHKPETIKPSSTNYHFLMGATVML